MNLVLSKFIGKMGQKELFQDIINICLYPADFNASIGDARGNSIPEFLNRFFIDFKKSAERYNVENQKAIWTLCDACSAILNLRGAGRGVITYNTLETHYGAPNALVKTVLKSVYDSQISSIEEFRNKTDIVIANIDYFYDFQKVTDGTIEIQKLLDALEDPGTSILGIVQQYKELGLKINSDLSRLSSIVHEESVMDYYTLSDESSVQEISESMVSNIWDNYSFFQTGLNVYDKSVGGFESSSLHLIMSPSNGGKSVSLANLIYNIAQHNQDAFEVDDAAIFVSCEDDLVKCNRKFMSIFGNYSYSNIRELYRKTSDVFTLLKKRGSDGQDAKKLVQKIFHDLMIKSVVQTTQGKLKIIFKYAPENSFSAADLARQIDKFRMQGIHVRYVIIDYLDTLRPSVQNIRGPQQDYDVLGTICQDLRSLSRIYSVPVITATQTSKRGDDFSCDMNNSIMGESWKKVKFSDFIYAQRINDDMDPFSPECSRRVFLSEDPENDPHIVPKRDLICNDLKVMEFKVTKSKEQGKNYFSYLLFSTQNLKLYNYVEEYLEDVGQLMRNNQFLSIQKREIDHCLMPQILDDNPFLDD